MVTLQFVLGGGLSSQAIAWFSAGHFSHVDAVAPSGELYGARSDRIGRVQPGVQLRPPFYEKWKDRVVMSLSVGVVKEKLFWDFLYAQEFKPYDSSAIWGFAAGRNWREADSWFCSELQMAALEYAGVVPALYTPSNKIAPVTLCTVISALGGKLP